MNRKMTWYVVAGVASGLLFEVMDGLIDRYGRPSVYSDEADWYPAACRSLGLEYHVYDVARRARVARLC